ncbi:MAG TPA: EutN/CcmL family microcompartment protein [Terriglobales bacterium]|jgi:ethanolamine utilization protein EutN|nr:EutN/CcmL family microcompartment protein [Terriglobales bacterium]
MMLAKVIGNVVATAKHPALDGIKLLLLQPLTRDGKPRGRPFVALDAVGAGFRETVYWCRGREAALAFPGEVPCDASVVGIVDAITAGHRSSAANPETSPPRLNKRTPGDVRKPRRKR